MRRRQPDPDEIEVIGAPRDVVQSRRIDLGFVAEHADVVELSFANRAREVEALQAKLAGLRARRPDIVLKIETRRGFENR